VVRVAVRRIREISMSNFVRGRLGSRRLGAFGFLTNREETNWMSQPGRTGLVYIVCTC
jgi:hypothetical protein